MTYMMKRMRPQKHDAIDAPLVKETVDMFLSRGGTITRCAPRTASAEVMYTATIAVDGYELPVMPTADAEYLPNFVCDVHTYDIAQRDSLTVHDDGTASMMRRDAELASTPTTQWHTIQRRRASREGADSMEE